MALNYRHFPCNYLFCWIIWLAKSPMLACLLGCHNSGRFQWSQKIWKTKQKLMKCQSYTNNICLFTISSLTLWTMQMLLFAFDLLASMGKRSEVKFKRPWP